ncbi:MAG: hypothetical protein C4345_15535, partial [Chloroflexota bacterium]
MREGFPPTTAGTEAALATLAVTTLDQQFLQWPLHRRKLRRVRRGEPHPGRRPLRDRKDALCIFEHDQDVA